MLDTIYDYLNTEGFSPHGMCLVWRPEVLWGHVVSDVLIAISYFSIPLALITYNMRRNSTEYRWVLWLFTAFILSCGVTHVMSIWTMWVPDYGLQAITKAICAAVSVATAIALWPLIPKALSLPTREALEDEVYARTNELKRVNLSLEDAVAKAQEANASKTRFLSVMSHELRTPLNTVIGFADLILTTETTDSPVPRPDVISFVGHIQQSGLHLAELIGDILDFSRIESGTLSLELARINVAPLAEKALSSVKSLAKANDISLEFVAKEPISPIVADETRLRQALLNLLSNAIKYNKPKGSVMLEVSQREEDVIVQVKDTGRGISDASLQHLFEPFNRGSAENTSIEGTGLGLPITERIVLSMGGTIDVVSELGAGTTFTLAFAASNENPASSQSASVEASDTKSVSLQDKRLLIVEDNPITVKLFQSTFKVLGTGIAIDVATDLSTAREMIINQVPDAIILDINLPDGNGLDFLAEIGARLEAVPPVIVVSADATKETRARAESFAEVQFVPKPIRVERLLGSIRTALANNEPLKS